MSFFWGWWKSLLMGAKKHHAVPTSSSKADDSVPDMEEAFHPTDLRSPGLSDVAGPSSSQDWPARKSLMSQRSKKDPRSPFYTFTLPPGLRVFSMLSSFVAKFWTDTEMFETWWNGLAASILRFTNGGLPENEASAPNRLLHEHSEDAMLTSPVGFLGISMDGTWRPKNHGKENATVLPYILVHQRFCASRTNRQVVSSER